MLKNWKTTLAGVALAVVQLFIKSPNVEVKDALLAGAVVILGTLAEDPKKKKPIDADN